MTQKFQHYVKNKNPRDLSVQYSEDIFLSFFFFCFFFFTMTFDFKVLWFASSHQGGCIHILERGVVLKPLS